VLAPDDSVKNLKNQDVLDILHHSIVLVGSMVATLAQPEME